VILAIGLVVLAVGASGCGVRSTKHGGDSHVAARVPPGMADTARTLDRSYGHRGWIRVPHSSTPAASAIGDDGSVLVVSGGLGDDVPPWLLRLTPGGRPDRRFGRAGRVRVPVRGWGRSWAVTVTPAGEPVVACVFNDSHNDGNRLYVFRYTATGRPDLSFGRGGVVTRHMDSSDESGDSIRMVVSGDGLTYVALTNAGGGAPEPMSEDDAAVEVYRLTASGRFDARWGSAGRVLVPIVHLLSSPTGSWAAVEGLQVLPSGDVQVEDSVYDPTTPDWMLPKRPPLAPNEIVPNDQPVAYEQVVRLTPRGGMDRAFASHGQRLARIDTTHLDLRQAPGSAKLEDADLLGGDAITLANADTLVARSAGTPGTVQLLMLRPNGSPDAAFADHGRMLIHFTDIRDGLVSDLHLLDDAGDGVGMVVSSSSPLDGYGSRLVIVPPADQSHPQLVTRSGELNLGAYAAWAVDARALHGRITLVAPEQQYRFPLTAQTVMDDPTTTTLVARIVATPIARPDPHAAITLETPPQPRACRRECTRHAAPFTVAGTAPGVDEVTIELSVRPCGYWQQVDAQQTIGRPRFSTSFPPTLLSGQHVLVRAWAAPVAVGQAPPAVTQETVYPRISGKQPDYSCPVAL
jgi:hypothetical protein